MKSTAAGIALTLALLVTPPAAAGGGFGSVSVQATTDTTITITWSDPGGKVRYASSPPQFEICYKRSGAWVGSCAGGTVVYTSLRPFTLTGLSPGETYKIKVRAYTEKKNLFGKWRNARYRKVGTVTQSTRSSATATTPHGTIEFVGATTSSATIRTHWSHPLDIERLVVCYKKTWYPIRLDSGCLTWILPNPDYGFAEIVQPTMASNEITISNLSKCRQYKFEAYALSPGGGLTLIGEAIKGRTSGKCGFSLLSEFIDSDDVLPLTYVDEVETFYGGSLSDHILVTNPELGRDHHVLESSGENVSEPLILLEYLIEAHPQVVETWQNESDLRQAGLRVEQFLERVDPQLLHVLQEDLAAEEVLALNDDRFDVYVTWETPDGGSGAGRAVPLTRDSGYIWFFDQDNVELVVKVLNACVPFERFWVFAAGLTNVAVDVTVVDTETNSTFEFSNPQGQPFQPVQATDAFATCP